MFCCGRLAVHILTWIYLYRKKNKELFLIIYIVVVHMRTQAHSFMRKRKRVRQFLFSIRLNYIFRNRFSNTELKEKKMYLKCILFSNLKFVFRHKSQIRRRIDRRQSEHARWHPFGPCPMWRAGLTEMAIRCVVQRCYVGQSHGIGRRTGTSARDTGHTRCAGRWIWSWGRPRWHAWLVFTWQRRRYIFYCTTGTSAEGKADGL